MGRGSFSGDGVDVLVMARTVGGGLVGLDGWGVLLAVDRLRNSVLAIPRIDEDRDDAADDIDDDTDDDDSGENAEDGAVSAMESHKMRMHIVPRRNEERRASRFHLRRLAPPFLRSRSTSSLARREDEDGSEEDGRDVQENVFMVGNVESIGKERDEFMTLLIGWTLYWKRMIGEC